MRRVELWLVTGIVHKPDEHRSKGYRRSVRFEAKDFADAAAHAEEALLAGWSHNPHVAIPLSLAPVLDNDGDALGIYVRDPEETPEP